MKIFPYLYEPDRSLEVNQETNEYLAKHPDVLERLQRLGFIYHDVGNIIPQTIENFWSGHYFPFNESWDELQISCTLSFFGLYKQGFASLRSGLELGLLSVYYNINDEGHQTVQHWYSSADSRDANTPRSDAVWKILLSHPHIHTFDQTFKIRSYFDQFNFLHNYVHTKGLLFSNDLGGKRGNFQVFGEAVFLQWLNTYENIIKGICILHMLKYPISVIEYDYRAKFGLDVPSFGGLEKGKIDRIASIVGPEYMELIKQIAASDHDTQQLLAKIGSMPDITEEDMEEQALDIYRSSIRHGRGFLHWEKEQYALLEQFQLSLSEQDFADFKTITLQRIAILRKWSEENNLMTVSGWPGDIK